MATSTLNLPVLRSGKTLGTAVLTVNERDADVVASIASTSISLPAGRYLLTTTIGSKPAGFEYPTLIQTLDTTLNSNGSASAPASGTFHAHKDVENGQTGTVYGMVDVKVWDGSGWRNYATSWKSESASSVAFSAAGSARTTQLRGANVHILAADSSQSAAKTTALLDMMVDLGMDTVRTSLAWCFVEQTTKGVIDPTMQSETDKFLNDCSARNLKVIAPFGGASPTWSAPGKTVSTFTSGWNNHTYQYTKYAPDNEQDFADGINLFLNRWGSQIYALEVGNEPNGSFWSDTAANYVAMTKTLYNTVKASAYSSIKVIGGVLAYNDTAYLQQLYDAGMKGYYDALSVHPYHYNLDGGFHSVYNPRQPIVEPYFFHGIAGLANLRDTMTANGDSAPLWVTEVGFSSTQNNTFPGVNLSEADQADFLKYSFRQLARLPYVDLINMHTMENAGSDRTNWQQNFGLAYSDHATIKPAYNTIKTTIAGLKAGTL
jgi:hypothetical protein